MALPACAFAQQNSSQGVDPRYASLTSGVLPPPHYDLPYYGKLIIVRESEERMKQLCPKSMFPVTVACSVRYNDGKACLIVIGDDKLISRLPWPYQAYLRHEIGHCNGWPADHRGARPLPPEMIADLERWRRRDEQAEQRYRDQVGRPQVGAEADAENVCHFGTRVVPCAPTMVP